MIRTFYYFLIRERSLRVENPCANFKLLKDPRAKAKRRPPIFVHLFPISCPDSPQNEHMSKAVESSP